jgi:hypothetical protein
VPARTVSHRTFGLCSVTVCMPVSGSVVVVGSTGVSARSSSTGVSAATAWPSSASTRCTAPAMVARTGVAGSATTDADTVTVLVTEPVATTTCGSTTSTDGRSGSSACAAWSAPVNASFARATAMTAHRTMRIAGNTIRRVTPTAPPSVHARGAVRRTLCRDERYRAQRTTGGGFAPGPRTWTSRLPRA